MVQSFRYPGSDVDYYRAHPAMFECLQNVYDHLINTMGKEVCQEKERERGAPLCLNISMIAVNA